MIGGTVITDIQEWSAEVGAILLALAGKAATSSSPAASSPAKASASLNVGVDPLPELTAGLGTITAVTNLVAAEQARNNTAPMQQADTAQKLQALRDASAQAVAHAEATGDFGPIRLLLS